MFLLWILGRQEKHFARPGPSFGRTVLQSRQNDETGALLIVASQVVEVVFLCEDVGLRGLLLAGEAPEDNGAVDLRRKSGTPSGEDRVRFALASLLGARRTGLQEHSRQGRYNDETAKRTQRVTTHVRVSFTYPGVRRARERGGIVTEGTSMGEDGL